MSAATIEAARSRGPRRYAVRGSVIAIRSCRSARSDWIEAADNYLKLHVGGKVHLARGTIGDAERELDASRFARIHRSTLVASTASPRPVGGRAGLVVELRPGDARPTLRRSDQAAARSLGG
ncbi:MAG: LytTR family DNA-binding domain-containing protein [Gemmatimonadales bacterium]